MNKISPNIRHYRHRDRDRLIRFWADAAGTETSIGQVSVPELINNLDRPNHFPEKNLFVAEISGDIIGYVDVIPELGIERVVLQCLVHPGHRRRGIAEKLVEQAVEWAGQSTAKVVHANVLQDDKAGKRLFSKMGFEFIRRYLELRIDLSKVHLTKMTRNDYPCRPMRQGEEEKLTRLQNRSFTDTWGFNPNTREEISYRLHRPTASPEDITLCLDGAEPIAYCWAKLHCEKNQDLDRGKGRINMLGVDPHYRGTGVGKKVLLKGLSRLKSRGVRLVDLTVDGENKVARALYRSVGFKVRTSSLWYQKDLVLCPRNIL